MQIPQFVKSIRLLLLGIGALITLNSCDSNFQASVDAPAQKYIPQKLIVMLPNIDSLRNIILSTKPDFEAKTGIQLRILSPSWDDFGGKIRDSFKNKDNAIDVYVVVSMWNGDLLEKDHVDAISDETKRVLDWQDILPIYRDTVLSWNKIAYGYPFDGDSVQLYYRKDIFSNPVYQQKFQQKFGYPLSIPDTWDKYLDAARFFSGWDWAGDGKTHYGLSGIRINHNIATLQFLSQAAAFAKYPGDDAYYFDPKTLKPRINNAGFVKALSIWIDSTAYGPPQMRHFSSMDARNSFISGESAMLIDWTDTPVYAADTRISVVKNKVGYLPLPASHQVFNSVTQQWENRRNQVASISGNWTFFVNKDSKNKALAIEYAKYMTAASQTSTFITDYTSGVNPSRYSHFKNDAIWQKAGFDTEDSSQYLSTIQASLRNQNWIYDLNIPHADEYLKVLDYFMHQALIKKMSPQAALDNVANAWDAITDRVGRSQQIKSYAAARNIYQKTSARQ